MRLSAAKSIYMWNKKNYKNNIESNRTLGLLPMYILNSQKFCNYELIKEIGRECRHLMCKQIIFWSDKL